VPPRLDGTDICFPDVGFLTRSGDAKAEACGAV
jgi:hypothetical protein